MLPGGALVSKADIFPTSSQRSIDTETENGIENVGQVATYLWWTDH